MVVLEKIRVKFGLAISIIIALALLSFIIDPNTLESALHSMSSKYDVGRIAGKSISYQDFQEEVDKFTNINEIMTGSSVQNEESQKQIRDAAWQNLLDKYMFIKNAKAAGINVGEDEMVDLTTGDNISPVLLQSGMFSDESGNFSPETLVEFVQQIDADQSGQLRTYWNYLQNTIHTQQYYSKFGSLFTKGNLSNALQVKDNMAFNNTTADVAYVMASYPVTRDSSIEVSANEIKAFYKNHKDFFKQKAHRDIEYVVYEVVPSEDDIEATNESIAAVYEEFCNTENMKAFLLKNSDRSLNDYWYKAGELKTISIPVDEQVFAGDNTTGIIKDGNSFFAARVLNSAMIPDSVYVKHILLQGDNAKATADSLLTVVQKGGNFANLAAQYSLDQSSAVDGEMGNIGWMTQTYMIPGFESVITADVNKPFVLDTQYGSHVVVVSRKTAPVAKKQVAILEKTALASKETFNKYYSQANTFATIANGTFEGYQKALDSTKVFSQKMSITEATSTFGTIDNAKEVTRWAFEAKDGKASNIITVNNNYFFVVALKQSYKEGYASVKDVAASIKESLYTDKLHDKYQAEIAGKIAGLSSIEAIAEALGTEVETNSDLALASPMVEPALLGTIFATEPGKISAPVAGILGVYVAKVNAKNDNAYYTEEDAKMYDAQKTQYTAQQVVPVMMELEDVTDNRERFF